MKEETIRQIGKDEGLSGTKLNIFVEFFSTRFPDELEGVHSYCAEWANRFKDDPTTRMDTQSKSIYLDILTREVI